MLSWRKLNPRGNTAERLGKKGFNQVLSLSTCPDQNKPIESPQHRGCAKIQRLIAVRSTDDVHRRRIKANTTNHSPTWPKIMRNSLVLAYQNSRIPDAHGKMPLSHVVQAPFWYTDHDTIWDVSRDHRPAGPLAFHLPTCGSDFRCYYCDNPVIKAPDTGATWREICKASTPLLP